MSWSYSGQSTEVANVPYRPSADPHLTQIETSVRISAVNVQNPSIVGMRLFVELLWKGDGRLQGELLIASKRPSATTSIWTRQRHPRFPLEGVALKQGV